MVMCCWWNRWAMIRQKLLAKVVLFRSTSYTFLYRLRLRLRCRHCCCLKRISNTICCENRLANPFRQHTHFDPQRAVCWFSSNNMCIWYLFYLCVVLLISYYLNSNFNFRMTSIKIWSWCMPSKFSIIFSYSVLIRIYLFIYFIIFSFLYLFSYFGMRFHWPLVENGI